MASKCKPFDAVLKSTRRAARSPQLYRQKLHARCIHATPVRRTDGVFRGLTDSRLQTPWIEAWRKQQEGKSTASSEATPQERDMTPKKMSDSYHRVVLPLGQDPWLSDTYINSSGHIRYAQLYHMRSCSVKMIF